jgi:hypothetical protein
MCEVAAEIAKEICDRRGPETVAEQVERATQLIAAHDAKIRREAYLRCADAIASYSAFGQSGIASEFRKWSNEADGGAELLTPPHPKT